MALRGDLASVDLAQVFQMLALNKKVGLLSIQSAKLWKVLYFDQRGVTVHHNVHAILDRVVASFVRTGRLTPEAVDEVRDHAARMGQELTDSLLAGGYLQPDELEGQYCSELEEEVYDLFFCREAKFEFHEGANRLDGRDGTIDERFFFNCDSVIMEAARRIDEWAYISERIPTTAEILVPIVDSADLSENGADAPAIFDLLDGRRNIARIVELTGLSNFQVCKVLSQLLDAGVIASVEAEELVPAAQQCMADGRLADAINLFERAVSLEIGVPEVHSFAAAAYQAAEEYEHAIYHLECEAEYRIAAGDDAGAAKKLLEVRQLVPTQLRARERLVELTLGGKAGELAGFDPLVEGKQLVDLLIEFGDISRVRVLLERLLLVEPNDPDLKKALVNVHVKAGDQKRVVELYESIADDLVRQGRPLEAVGYLQKILLLDRGRSDISERVRKLYEFDERSRKRRRSLAALATLFCLTLVAGVGYWFYNQRAEDVFATIDVQEEVAREDFAGAMTAYEDFLLRHPFTTAAPKARAELQQIEALQQRFEAERTAARVERERELKRLRSEYKLLWTRYREQFLAGQPEDSMESLTKVRDLVGKAGSPDDMAWAMEQQVERMWQKLRQFLDDAAKLADDYDAALGRGDWQTARALALRLLTEFDSTRSARRCQIPVWVNTRPSGATLTQNGQPLQRTVDGRSVPVVTPTMILCPQGSKVVTVTANLAGFTPLRIDIDPDASGSVEAVMEVVADRAVAFESQVQTGVGLGEGWLAVGLRGGRLGLSRLDGRDQSMHELPGLRAVDSTPVIAGGRVFFVTTENSLECVPLDRSVPVTGWPVQLQSPLATELVARDGRVLAVDRDHVLHCWEQATARPLWSVSIEGPPSGPPTIDRRQVRIGTVEGRVITIEASNGQILGVLRADVGISTRVMLDDKGRMFFGLADGRLRAVDSADGRVIWSVPAGRTVADGELGLGADVLVALGADGKLLVLDRANGAIVGRIAIGDGQVLGTQVRGRRGVVKVRRPRVAKKPPYDVLLAFDLTDCKVQWEFSEEGIVPGQPGLDDLMVAWPSANQGVVLFR
ncbi:MAG: PQQ-binding-like beta-propeller repeat protein [Planctomycetes bacterium]|nr:PQQ-binding-like beta-propeller repeat protein [Planctomycetota bacterium]